jgi:hypothetical protein
MKSSSLRQLAARLGALLCVSAVLLSPACGSKAGKGDAGVDGGAGSDDAGSAAAGNGGAGSGGAGSGGAGASGAAGLSDAGGAAVDATDAPEAPLADAGSTADADAAGGGGGTDASDAGAGVVCFGGRTVRSDQEYQALVAEHCAELTGGLFISSTTAGPTLTLSPPLVELTKIGGDLRVHALPGLKSMAAFSHLESVGGTLAIYTNDDMESLDGLERLRFANGVQLNSTNPLLASVSGLANLETVGSTFILYAPVKSLQGWHLKSVTGAFFIAGTRLGSLEGLEHVTSLGGLQVANNPDLASLGPLSKWPKGAVKTFSVNDNPKLPQCQVDAFTTAQGVACATCTNNTGTGTCN